MSRRDSRIAAFGLLFESDFHPDVTFDELLERARDVREMNVDKFAVSLYKAATDNIAAIDGEIEKASTNWKLSRMSAVSRSIVRLAVAEFMFTDCPPKVAINEAVEIAKVYDDDKAPSFINGVLNRIARSLGKIEDNANRE